MRTPLRAAGLGWLLVLASLSAEANLWINNEGDNFAYQLARGDFNGDGLDDLAVTAKNDGASGVVYLFKGNGQKLEKSMPVLTELPLDANEGDDQFGSSLAVGDFNNDGIDDLAVGAKGESLGGLLGTGALFIFKGSANGLQPWQMIDQGQLDSNEQGDAFGTVLAAGDFNGDGHDDLAAAAPEEDIGADADAGRVLIFHGAPNQLTPVKALSWSAPGVLTAGQVFGMALTAGDFDGDGRDDLAVGRPTWMGVRSNVGDLGPGSVVLFQGSAVGPTLWGVLDQATLGASQERGFGRSLAGGDFDADGRVDLAVGAFNATAWPAGPFNLGRVYVYQGSPGGPVPSQALTQGALDPKEPQDAFGFTLGTGDLNNDGFDDLVVGNPYEDGSGRVFIFRAQGGWLVGWASLRQSGLDLDEPGDRFGNALATGNFSGDGRNKLAVGAYHEAIGTIDGAGQLHVFRRMLFPSGGQWKEALIGIQEINQEQQ